MLPGIDELRVSCRNFPELVILMTLLAMLLPRLEVPEQLA